MIEKEKIQEVKECLKFIKKTYSHLIVWQDDNNVSFDGKDAMIELSEKTKQVTVVTNADINSYSYKEKGYIGGTYTAAIHYILI